MLADNSHQKLRESSDAGRNVPDESGFGKADYRNSYQLAFRKRSQIWASRLTNSWRYSGASAIKPDPLAQPDLLRWWLPQSWCEPQSKTYHIGKTTSEFVAGL